MIVLETKTRSDIDTNTLGHTVMLPRLPMTIVGSLANQVNMCTVGWQHSGGRILTKWHASHVGVQVTNMADVHNVLT